MIAAALCAVLGVQAIAPELCLAEGNGSLDGNNELPSILCDIDIHTRHNLTHTVAAEPTAETAGNIEYWYCAGCGKGTAADGGCAVTLL